MGPPQECGQPTKFTLLKNTGSLSPTSYTILRAPQLVVGFCAHGFPLYTGILSGMSFLGWVCSGLVHVVTTTEILFSLPVVSGTNGFSDVITTSDSHSLFMMEVLSLGWEGDMYILLGFRPSQFLVLWTLTSWTQRISISCHPIQGETSLIGFGRFSGLWV